MEVAFEDWMLSAAALALGLCLGWIFWGMRRGAEAASEDGVKSGETSAPAAGGTSSDPGTDMSGAPLEARAAPPPTAPGEERLGDIERELKEARALLEEGEEELRLFGEELAELDAAIKRASGRLRLLFREIRQRALGGDVRDDD
ncbi:MAG: hypothetical protein HXY23_03295 [Parvularculaceae bacterium]|jgi:hypothetical protein|nr:hypothetical protein [Parvularculaceae bacterium]